MKTALGYLFLSLAASLIGVVLVVLYYAVTGQLRTLDVESHDKVHMIGLCIYSVLHVAAVIPLTYFGFKWINEKKSVEEEKDANDRNNKSHTSAKF